ncbi:uncharacterized protein CCOS01_07091 [Colletotrichum costaricense]|uniref:Uncharacterized protein n=1 Tax=Colletotrichum costaricense TaxID=1209916 RepID=A0AAJ0E2G9_9PEZI|nr:uncharacterized protein CCOS01_07091 [Colletotrichum costaricense]KAK1529257.1 hypothetical protein CCOS01_07091 [Colletotrichum costaricense]
MSKYGLGDLLEGPEAFDIYLGSSRTIAGFRILLKYAGRRYQSFPFNELRSLLPETENLTIDALVSSRSAGYCSLFQSLAFGMVRQTAIKWSKIDSVEAYRIQWCELLRTCLELDPAGLCHLEEAEFPCHATTKSQTAFSFLIDKAPYWFFDSSRSPIVRWGSGFRLLQRGISAWLDVLALNGIDLLDYGRKERLLHDEGLTTTRRKWHYTLGVNHGTSHLLLRLRLLGITYGKSKDDWRFWWVSEYEHYVGEFWAMVHRVDLDVKVPGSWVDEFDYYYYEYHLEQKIAREWLDEEPMPLIWSEYH